MGAHFTLNESSTLYRLLAESTSDIIIKTDRDGFIVHASPGIERLGVPLRGMLIGPHILDLVHPACAAAIRSEHEAAITGRHQGHWIEFPAVSRDRQERWFEIRMQSLRDEQARVYGALGIMRSIEDRRAFEEQLFAAAMTDPLTGLTNRRAFIAMLQHLVNERIAGCLALLDLDHFKAINLKYGQAVGDEVLVQFADFVRTLTRSQDIISRVGGESLGILLPQASQAQAEAVCQRILAALSEMRVETGAGRFSITASAGVARIAGSLDNTLKRAEMALFFAKATGRNRLESDQGPQSLWAQEAQAP